MSKHNKIVSFDSSQDVIDSNLLPVNPLKTYEYLEESKILSIETTGGMVQI